MRCCVGSKTIAPTHIQVESPDGGMRLDRQEHLVLPERARDGLRYAQRVPRSSFLTDSTSDNFGRHAVSGERA